MDEPVERVAERIHQGLRAALLGTDTDWADEFIGNRSAIRVIARAAIAATREPTDAMCKAGEAWLVCSREDVREIWRAMTDAALAD